MTALRSESEVEDLGDAFAVWPPPRMSEVDPFYVGVAIGADGPRGRSLTPAARASTCIGLLVLIPA
jgi:hypothetical protein